MKLFWQATTLLKSFKIFKLYKELEGTIIYKVHVLNQACELNENRFEVLKVSADYTPFLNK